MPPKLRLSLIPIEGCCRMISRSASPLNFQNDRSVSALALTSNGAPRSKLASPKMLPGPNVARFCPVGVTRLTKPFPIR